MRIKKRNLPASLLLFVYLLFSEHHSITVYAEEFSRLRGSIGTGELKSRRRRRAARYGEARGLLRGAQKKLFSDADKHDEEMGLESGRDTKRTQVVGESQNRVPAARGGESRGAKREPSPMVRPTSQIALPPATPDLLLPRSLPTTMEPTIPSSSFIQSFIGATVTRPPYWFSPSDGPSQSSAPTNGPSSSPSLFPSLVPSTRPSATPSAQPSWAPSVNPSPLPTSPPFPPFIQATVTRPPVSSTPTNKPSSVPSLFPSLGPSNAPLSSVAGATVTGSPYLSPVASEFPAVSPSKNPSLTPSLLPSRHPSSAPSIGPSESPTIITHPSQPQTVAPTARTVHPTGIPSELPTTSQVPTHSSHPSRQPSSSPSLVPSVSSASPSLDPSESPSAAPTATAASANNNFDSASDPNRLTPIELALWLLHHEDMLGNMNLDDLTDFVPKYGWVSARPSQSGANVMESTPTPFQGNSDGYAVPFSGTAEDVGALAQVESNVSPAPSAGTALPTLGSAGASLGTPWPLPGTPWPTLGSPAPSSLAPTVAAVVASESSSTESPSITAFPTNTPIPTQPVTEFALICSDNYICATKNGFTSYMGCSRDYTTDSGTYSCFRSTAFGAFSKCGTCKDGDFDAATCPAADHGCGSDRIKRMNYCLRTSADDVEGTFGCHKYSLLTVWSTCGPCATAAVDPTAAIHGRESSILNGETRIRPSAVERSGADLYRYYGQTSATRPPSSSQP